MIQYNTQKVNVPRDVKTFEELKVYEKLRGCKFVFVDTLQDGKGERYRIEDLIDNLDNKKQKYPNWWRGLPENVFKYRKNLCKKGEVVTLNADGNPIKKL